MWPCALMDVSSLAALALQWRVLAHKAECASTVRLFRESMSLELPSVEALNSLFFLHFSQSLHLSSSPLINHYSSPFFTHLHMF